MGKTHRYAAKVTWTGVEKGIARNYREYSREHLIEVPGKAPVRGSADPAFLGDSGLHNPEDMLVASLSACHMLWYLHLCTVNGIAVAGYVDDAGGVMVEDRDRGGYFDSVTLKPCVTIVAGDADLALSLHEQAHKKCFIANSMNFPVRHEAEILVEESA